MWPGCGCRPRNCCSIALVTAKASESILATLQKRRAALLLKIEEGVKAQALVSEIDATLAKLAELAGEPVVAPLTIDLADEPPPPVRRAKKTKTPKATAGKFQTGYPAKLLAILKRTPGEPVRARDAIEEIAAELGIKSGTKERKVLDISTRNSLSILYQDPSSGVEKVSFGFYRWNEPKPSSGEQLKLLKP